MKVLKKMLVVVVLVGISFTNIPYHVLTKIIDSYVKANNIVDKDWHLSNNENVVDNFTPSFRNKAIRSLYKLAGETKVEEAMAAVNYVGGQVASFAGKTGATTVTFALTGGIATTPAAGDLVIVAYSVGSTADRALTIQNASAVNYTLAGSELYQNDTYDSNLRVAYRFMPGTPETSMVLSGTGSTADAGAYTIHVFRGVDPTTPLDVAAVVAGGIDSRLANPNPITPITSGAWLYVAGAASGGTGGTYTAAYLSNFRATNSVDTNDALIGAGYTTWTSGTYDPAAFAGGGTNTVNDSWTAVTLALRPAVADTTPPTPNPMTFASNPNNVSASQIDMVASVANDATSPPVNYYFTLNTGSCTAGHTGTGAADSGWQSGTSYSDTGLQPNKCYGYSVKARDSVGTPNETTASGVVTIYTSANVPGTPTLDSPTANTLILTNAENSNPASNPTTYFAAQVVTADASWLNKWVDASGNPSATSVWLTDSQLDGITLNGLQPSTVYGVKVKAKNQDNEETTLSVEGQGTTSASADTSPPTPNPMTFASPPNNASATQVDMTASTASDTSGPVSYLFSVDNSACGANSGTGGSNSAWQTETAYSDTGLQPNKCYGYAVQARDAMGTPNVGTASGVSSAYTSANVPGTPTLGSATVSTLALTNAENSNPSANPTTYYAVQVVTTNPTDSAWLNKWVNGTGNSSASAVWLTDAQLDALVLQGLQAGTTYGVKVKAKNQDNDETALSAEGQGTTSAPLTLNISATTGNQAASLNSGDTSKFINDVSCTSESNCSAIKLSASNGSVTVTSIKITESGTVSANADLSNTALLYDTDANYSNGTAGTFGTAASFAADQTVTFSNAGLTISSGSTYYFYIRFDLKNGSNYPAGGQTIEISVAGSNDVGTSGSPAKSGTAVLAGTTSIKPQIIGYSNSTESGLNYSGGCSGCGARIGPDSIGKAQVVTISGYGFGSDPGSGNRDSASNKVEIGTKVFTDNPGSSNVVSWSNTSITIKTDTAVDNDSSWGANYGGATSLKVTAGGQAVPANLNFYVFPQVTGLTVCNSSGFPVGDNAREYDASDAVCPNGLKDGEIILNGTRFGTASTGGNVSILGSAAATTAWTSSSITAQVPSAIGNNVYTGSLSMQQGSGTSNKSHTYTSTGFRILPRITSLSPASGTTGDSITFNGNHLCQNGGVCPTAFGLDDKIVFYNNFGATVFTSWADTAVQSAVPNGADSGNVVVTSNGYSSNAQGFNFLSPIPDDPSSLNQFRDESLSQSIALGGTVSSTPIYLTLSMFVDISGGTLYPQFEFKPVGTAFSCSGNGPCGAAVEGNGKAGPGPINCGTLSNNCAVSISPGEEIYHWQARVRHNKGGSDYYSAWVPYPRPPSDNSEAATDFKVDSSAPAINSGPSATQSTNSVVISWGTTELSTTQVQYNKTGVFVANCSTNNDCTTLDQTQNTSHTVEIKNLDSGTTYYYRVRSKDSSGNEIISSNGSFTTDIVSQPGKTAVFFIASSPNTISSPISFQFAVALPESSYSIKSTYIEISGISQGAGTNNITIGVNAEATKTYVIPSGDSSFKIYHPVNSLNVDPSTNQLDIIPSENLNIVSAKLIVSYAYTP